MGKHQHQTPAISPHTSNCAQYHIFIVTKPKKVLNISRKTVYGERENKWTINHTFSHLPWIWILTRQKKTCIKDFTKLSDTVLIILDYLGAKKFFHIMPLKDLKKRRKPQITFRTESLWRLMVFSQKRLQRHKASFQNPIHPGTQEQAGWFCWKTGKEDMDFLVYGSQTGSWSQ